MCMHYNKQRVTKKNTNIAIERLCLGCKRYIRQLTTLARDKRSQEAKKSRFSFWLSGLAVFFLSYSNWLLVHYLVAKNGNWVIILINKVDLYGNKYFFLINLHIPWLTLTFINVGLLYLCLIMKRPVSYYRLYNTYFQRLSQNIIYSRKEHFHRT